MAHAHGDGALATFFVRFASFFSRRERGLMRQQQHARLAQRQTMQFFFIGSGSKSSSVCSPAIMHMSQSIVASPIQSSEMGSSSKSRTITSISHGAVLTHSLSIRFFRRALASQFDRRRARRRS